MTAPGQPDPDKLTAAQRSKIRRLSAPKELSPEDEAGELNIVPFLDIVTNVLMFVLASISVSFTVALTAEPPKSGGSGVSVKMKDESLNLTVLITSEGFAIKGRAASIAPGCEGTGAGTTVPRVGAKGSESADGKKYDYDGLRKCVRKLKDEVPNADQEQQVMVSANPNVPFQEIVRVMDTVRNDDKGELFPKVVFSVLK